MKTTRFFSLIMIVILGLTVWLPQSSQASDRSKKVGNCVYCKLPVHSYRHFKAYSRGKPVYAWSVSGHSKCGARANSTSRVSPVSSNKATAKMVEAKKVKTKHPLHKKEKVEKKHEVVEVVNEPNSYAQHANQQMPQAYGGGSGYGLGHGGVNGYGRRVSNGYGNGRGRGHFSGNRAFQNNPFQRNTGNVHGSGYGNSTVTSSTTVTRSTPSTLGSVGGGFRGTSTRTYTTRTQTNYRDSYGRIRSGAPHNGNNGHHARPHVSHY